MPAEYRTLTLADAAEDEEIDAELNSAAAAGWVVKAAHSRVSYLLERLPPAPIPRAEPRPPTGAPRSA